MRISERKRQLREKGGSATTDHPTPSPRPAPVPKPRPVRQTNSRATAARPAPRTGKAAATASTRPAPRQRGSRFYGGVGIAGLVLSGILIESTVVSYNHNKSAYPAALATYRKNLAAYHAALARYQAAVAHHIKPLPVLPHQPVAPQEPTISAGSFALPVLYMILSLAYLYLAYRAAQRTRAAGTRTSTAK